MFTPPPSQLPFIQQVVDPSDVIQTANRPTENTPTVLSKQRFHCWVRWTIVPLMLMSLAAFTRFWTHPAVFDLLSIDGTHEWTERTKVWSVHEPHKVASDRSTSNPLVARNTTIPIPTVPANPVLPIPFPQPFDTTLSTNFSTTSCYDFFLNMTQQDAFRECRPFSLLISSSYAFSQAQKDVNAMNTDIWGTCNTAVSQVQCDANMSWFASSLQASCQTDLANQVATAMVTLNGDYHFDQSLSYYLTCHVDPATNSYCFIEAVANSNPSSYWFYQLPLGQPLGSSITTSACNECTSALMVSYASALNSTNCTTLVGLAETYNTAAETLNNVCGSSFAQAAQVSTWSSAWVNAGVPGTSSLVVLVALVLFAGMLCGN